VQVAVNRGSKIVCAYHIAHNKNTLAAVAAIFKLLSSTGAVYLLKENILL
jgi:hypothetical protein